MSVLDQTSKDLRVARVLMHKLNETFKDFQSYSYSVFALGDQWRTLQTSFATTHNSLEERVKEVEVKEWEVDVGKNRVQNLQKEVELRQKKLELEEKSSSERIEEVELREKQLRDWCECLELEKRALVERCKAVEMREKRFAESFKLVRAVDVDVKERLTAVEERERAVKDREDMSSVREKEIKDNVEAMELREKVIIESGKELDVKEKELFLKESLLDLLEKKEVKLEEDRKELELKENEMDEIYSVLMLKEKEIDEKSTMLMSKEKMLGLKEKEIDQHRKVVEAKEKAMELEQKRINESSKHMEVKEKEIEERFLALHTKETQINYLSKGLMSKEKELDEQMDEPVKVQSDGQCLPSHCQAQELREKQSGNSSLPHLNQELPDSDIHQVACPIDSSSLSIGGDIHSLCINMDADGLRSYLTKHHENIIHEKILDALRHAPDPGKLVFEVAQSSSHQIFLDKAEAIANKNSCILLLQQFMKLSPPIIREVKEEAKNFAKILKSKLNGMGNTPADNFRFLQFVAAFKLASCYAPHELLPLFKIFYTGHEVYRREQQPWLCHALGLSKKIPDVIKSLIGRNKLLIAIKYVCVFKLENIFPLVPLLEAYLNLSYKKVNEKQSLKSKIEAEHSEFSILRQITKCIATFKLESKFPPDFLVSRMKELEERRPGALTLLQKRSASSYDSVASPTQLQKRARVGN